MANISRQNAIFWALQFELRNNSTSLNSIGFDSAVTMRPTNVECLDVYCVVGPTAETEDYRLSEGGLRTSTVPLL